MLRRGSKEALLHRDLDSPEEGALLGEKLGHACGQRTQHYFQSAASALWPFATCNVATRFHCYHTVCFASCC